MTPLPQVDAEKEAWKIILEAFPQSEVKKAFNRFVWNMNKDLTGRDSGFHFNVADDANDAVALLNDASDFMEAMRDPSKVTTFTGFDQDGNPQTLDEWLLRDNPKELAEWKFRQANPETIDEFIARKERENVT